MIQEYDKYTEEDVEVWNLLFSEQQKNLAGRAHPEYIECLDKMSPALNADSIPRFEELNRVLSEENGWTIEVVPGLISVEEFFTFLSNKKFCSSTWLRAKENMEYLEEPDMFHDIFGHVPLLMNADYSDFVQKLGEIGVRYSDDEMILKKLQRLYWFTIEFGLIRFQEEVKLYGAGIISSSGETKHIYEDDIEILNYDLNKILNQDFNLSEIQQRYFIIDSLSQLYNSIEELGDFFQEGELQSVSG